MSTVEVTPELQEIRGPSAFGGGWRRFVDLLWLMSANEFRTQYARTALGFLWSIVRPLVYFGVIFLILREVLRFGPGVKDYGIILVLNLILFTYFQEATTRAVRSVSQREPMVRKMQFPRIIIPLSVSLTAALSMIVNLLVLLPILLLFGLEVHETWLWFPLLLLGLITLTTGVSMLLSVLYVRYRDTAQVWSLISRLLFYASPVLFPIELVPDSFQEYIAASPLAPILELTRLWVVDPTAPGPTAEVGTLVGLVIPVALSVAICVGGLWLFERDAPRFAEEL